MKLEMSTTSQKSAETVANIEELLKQILERVPALSLISFKCVSKQWLSLITDPDFCRHHTLLNPRPKISAFFNESFNSIPPAYDSSKILSIDGCNLRILQSCNGLFLCHNIPVSDYHANHHPVFVVNPTTNQFRAVSSPNVRVRYEFVRYALAFDPSKSPHYKVVCITNHPNYSDEGHHKIDIYSSETREWKHLQTPFFRSPSVVGRLHDYTRALHFDHMSTDDAVYCNGAVHWIRIMSSTPFCVMDGRCEFRREETDVLHYFDTSQDRLLVVSAIPPVPSVVENIPLEVNRYGSIMPTIWPSLTRRYFGESGGRLYLIDTYKHCMTQFDVMEMRWDYSGWFVKYHVDLDPLVTGLSGQDSIPLIIVLCISQAEETIQETGDEVDLVLHMPGKVISYNLRNQTFKTSIKLANKELFLASSDKYRIGDDVTFPFMETLASL